MPLTATVTGTVKDILTNPVPNAVVTIALWNYGNNVPTVSGGSIIVVPVITVKANGSGVFTAAPYGNDQITPAGTVYTVTFADSNSLTISTATYNFTSGNTYDLGVFAPNVTYPIPVAVGPVNATQLQGINILAGTPTDGQVLTYVDTDTKAEWKTASSGGSVPLHRITKVLNHTNLLNLDSGVVIGSSTPNIAFVPVRAIAFSNVLGVTPYVGMTGVNDFTFQDLASTFSYLSFNTANLLSLASSVNFSIADQVTPIQFGPTGGIDTQMRGFGPVLTGGNAGDTVTLEILGYYYDTINKIFV